MPCRVSWSAQVSPKRAARSIPYRFVVWHSALVCQWQLPERLLHFLHCSCFCCYCIYYCFAWSVDSNCTSHSTQYSSLSLTLSTCCWHSGNVNKRERMRSSRHALYSTLQHFHTHSVRSLCKCLHDTAQQVVTLYWVAAAAAAFGACGDLFLAFWSITLLHICFWQTAFIPIAGFSYIFLSSVGNIYVIMCCCCCKQKL